VGFGFAGAKGGRVITSIAVVAITIALLFIVALVNKLWAIVQLQSCLLDMTRARIAKLETKNIRLSLGVSKLERATTKDLGNEQAR
jgi:hypothetical protein